MFRRKGFDAHQPVDEAVTRIDERGKGDGNHKLQNVAGRRDLKNLRKGCRGGCRIGEPLPPETESDKAYDKAIEQLRDERGAGSTQPEGFAAGEPFEQPEDRDIRELADQVRERGSQEQTLRRAKDGIE